MAIQLGDLAQSKHTFSEAEVLQFARLSGDFNPVHLDAEFAKTTLFGARIVHGFFVGSMISALIAGTLPGAGSVYLSQTMDFLKPVYLGDEITAQVEVIEVLKPGTYILQTQCFNSKNEVVITGKAKVKVMRQAVV